MHHGDSFDIDEAHRWTIRDCRAIAAILDRHRGDAARAHSVGSGAMGSNTSKPRTGRVRVTNTLGCSFAGVYECLAALPDHSRVDGPCPLYCFWGDEDTDAVAMVMSNRELSRGLFDREVTHRVVRGFDHRVSTGSSRSRGPRPRPGSRTGSLTAWCPDRRPRFGAQVSEVPAPVQPAAAGTSGCKFAATGRSCPRSGFEWCPRSRPVHRHLC